MSSNEKRRIVRAKLDKGFCDFYEEGWILDVPADQTDDGVKYCICVHIEVGGFELPDGLDGVELPDWPWPEGFEGVAGSEASVSLEEIGPEEVDKEELRGRHVIPIEHLRDVMCEDHQYWEQQAESEDAEWEVLERAMAGKKRR